MVEPNAPSGRPEPPGPPAATDTNPYIGPRSFEEKDSHNFYGRTKEIRELSSLVIAHRVVLFYAQSGAGKTSVLQAGLVPRLRQRKKIMILPIGRVGGDLPPGVLRTEVGNIYVFNLLLSLLGQAVNPRDLLGLSLMDGLKPFSTAQHPVDEVRPNPRLLILDQFEELYTTHQDRYPERGNFFLQLQQALGTYPQLSLLLTMREDHIAHLDSYAVQMPDRLRIRYRMEQLHYEVALEAVQEPAEQAGIPFAPGVAQGLIDNLRRIQSGTVGDPAGGPQAEPVEVVIRLDRPLASFTPAEQAQLKAHLAEWLNLSPDQIVISGIEEGSVILTTRLPAEAARTLEAMVQAGDPRLAPFQLTELSLPPSSDGTAALGSYVEPVQLQIVCRQLWSSLPPGRDQILADDVQAFGDVDQALIDFYEQALDKVVRQTGISQRLLRLWFDTRLITPARTRGVVHQGAEETAGLANPAVGLLNNAYIIRADIRGNDLWYELAHDRLVEPILAANQRWLATYHNPLASAYKAWLAAGRDPKKLLKGSQLEEAEAYAKDFPADVTEEERHYLAESRYQARQEARRRRNLVLGALLVIILLSLCTVAAVLSAQRADRELRNAQTAQARADQQKSRAEAAGGTAIAEGDKAATAEANALFQRDNAATSEMSAVQQGLEAQAAAATAQADRDRAATARAEALFQEGQANEQKATAEAAGGTAIAERDHAATAQAEALAQEALANQQAATAQAAQATAEAERNLAATAQAEAEAASAEAERQRAAAEAAARAAREAEATAEAERENAESQACLAQANLAKTLAANAQAILANKTRHRDLALLLAREAVLIDQAVDCISVNEPETALLAAINEPWRGTAAGSSGSFSPDGARLATTDGINTWLYDTQDASLIAGPLAGGHEVEFGVAVFSPDGTRLATMDGGSNTWLYDTQDGSRIAGPLNGGFFELEFSPDGARLATTDGGSNTWLYDTQDGSRIAGPLNGYFSEGFSPDGTRLTTTAGLNTSLYDTQDGSLIFGPSFGDLAKFSPDGTRLAISGINTYLLDSQDGSLIAGPLAGDSAAGFSPDGTRLATVNAGNTWLYDGQNGSLIAGPLAGEFGAFSPARTRLATTDINGPSTWLYDSQNGSLIAGPLTGGTGLFDFADQFSPDGTRLAITDYTNLDAWLYDTQDGSLIEGPLNGNFALGFSPDGTRLATTDGPNTWLYDPQDGSPIAGSLDGTFVGFSPNGTRLVTWALSNAWLYDTQGGLLIVGPVESILLGSISNYFSPDSSTWATSPDDITLLWDTFKTKQSPVPTAQLLQIGLDRVLRDPPQLTAAERAEFGLN